LLIVVVVPVPAIAPGFIVHVPDGRPFSTTPPVDPPHDGCVTAPTSGAAGAVGASLIVTVVEAGEMHPGSLIT
jgi:hypothetical protein